LKAPDIEGNTITATDPGKREQQAEFCVNDKGIYMVTEKSPIITFYTI
jgi:hypothetical protein